MILASISEFRKNLKFYVEKVSNNFETLIISRGKNDGVVLISLQEYNSLMATEHELSSKKNKKRLDTAIEKFNKGLSFEKQLIEE